MSLQAPLFTETDALRGPTRPSDPLVGTLVPPTLRADQADAVQKMEASYGRGNTRILLQAPCGWGKSFLSSHMIYQARSRGEVCWFVSGRREINYSAVEALEKFGLASGLTMAGETPDPLNPVQVVSRDTLARRMDKVVRSPDFVVIDEAHRHAHVYEEVFARYPKARVMAMSATPARSSGRGLGDLYEDMIKGPATTWLTEQGYLSPLRYFAPTDPDLQGLKLRQGDYVPAELEKRMDRPALIGDVLEHWARLASDRKTIVFCTTVRHSVHMRDEFRAIGVRAEHIDGKTAPEERRRIFAAFSAGEVQVLTNAMVFADGINVRDIGCVVWARPTRSLVLWHQGTGRVQRSAPGKEDAIVIDHAGAVALHGFVCDPVEWTLCSGSKPQVHSDTVPGPVIRCEDCKRAYRGNLCPECHTVGVMQTDLAEVTGSIVVPQTYSMSEKRRWLDELYGYATSTGRNAKAARDHYYSKFREWPSPDMTPSPRTPGFETLAFLRNNRWEKC